MDKWFKLSLVAASCFILTACNTVEGTVQGAGQDVQAVTKATTTHKTYHHKAKKHKAAKKKNSSTKKTTSTQNTQPEKITDTGTQSDKTTDSSSSY